MILQNLRKKLLMTVEMVHKVCEGIRMPLGLMRCKDTEPTDLKHCTGE